MLWLSVIIEYRAFSASSSVIGYFFRFFLLVGQSPLPSLGRMRGTVKGLPEFSLGVAPSRRRCTGPGGRGGHEGRERGLLKIGFGYIITRISAAVAYALTIVIQRFCSSRFLRLSTRNRRSSRNRYFQEEIIS